MSVTATTATIVQHSGKSWWHCPNCRRTIGEVCGVRLIVMIKGRSLTFPLTDGMTQTCPECGFESEYRVA